MHQIPIKANQQGELFVPIVSLASFVDFVCLIKHWIFCETRDMLFVCAFVVYSSLQYVTVLARSSVVRGNWTRLALFCCILGCLLFLICIEFVYLYFPVLFCLSVSVKWLAVKTASEMTYTVSSGALNSTPTPAPASKVIARWALVSKSWFKGSEVRSFRCQLVDN